MTPEAADFFATVTLVMSLDKACDLAVSVCKRSLFATVPDRMTFVSFAIIVEFAILALIRFIIYISNVGLYFGAFDYFAYFCG